MIPPSVLNHHFCPFLMNMFISICHDPQNMNWNLACHFSQMMAVVRTQGMPLMRELMI
uniref:Uncharacterized protein n=1 Tax=Arundo donax TaxID=35708 RepID=A0A0A9E4R5_ARUDO